MRSRFNLLAPAYHLSSIELIDAAENGWSRKPQLRIANRVY